MVYAPPAERNLNSTYVAIKYWKQNSFNQIPYWENITNNLYWPYA